ncbi:MAG: HAMP domain-containing histidine kinase, partial [Spirochaetales bacterium]|nr:HAMP domain-containing histidine kinase [Spirochaetales bacterium]
MRTPKVLEEAQKTIKRRWKFIEGKERPIVYIGLFLSFILSVVFIYLIYDGITEGYMLQMKFDSEKSFNSIYMALADSNSKALSVMEDEGVMGIGVYSSSGQAFQRLGDVPVTLPLSKLAQGRKSGQDSTLGIYILDDDSNQIEYFRLSRLNVVLEMGNLSPSAPSSQGPQNQMSYPFDVPDIIYVRFDGTKYFNSVRRARVLTIIGMSIMTLLLLMILSIYNNNRKYRMQLQKNQSLAKLGAAARTLTHEIKNPLSAMTIQSALMRKLLPEEFHPDLDVIDHEITRLTNLTNRVSEFLKNQSGNPQKIELVAFIKDIARLFKGGVPVDSDTEQVKVSFDPDRARSVFENLIKNATESCEGRDPEVKVEIRCRHRMVTVRVLDRGDGIPQNTRAKLFDPFFTTKIHGSGIGLAISKQFVEAQGGTLKLYDRDGGGTVAEVSLP